MATKNKSNVNAVAEGKLDSEGGVTAAMMDNSILLEVKFTKIGNVRSVPNTVLKQEVAKGRAKVTKTLFDSEELQAIKKIDDEVRAFLNAKSLAGIWKSGIHLLPTVSVEKAEDFLVEKEIERNQAVETFIQAYPRLVQESKDELPKEWFKIEDYPCASYRTNPETNLAEVVVSAGYEDAIRETFSMAWRYLAFSQVPKVLAKIKPELFKREREKISAELKVVGEEAKYMVRQNFAAVVKHMMERLETDADGKPKQFKGAAIKNIEKFLEEFPALNTINDDGELKALADQAKKLLNGVDGVKVRKSEELRDNLRAEFSKLESVLDSMLVNKPKRAITFGEDV